MNSIFHDKLRMVIPLGTYLSFHTLQVSPLYKIGYAYMNNFLIGTTFIAYIN